MTKNFVYASNSMFSKGGQRNPLVCFLTQRNNIQKVVKDTIGQKYEEDSTGHLHGWLHSNSRNIEIYGLIQNQQQ